LYNGNRINGKTKTGSEKMDKKQQPGLAMPELISGILIRRYKRFLADILTDDGETITAHCPNSGAMTACCEPGRRVYVSCHDRPERKLKYTWELIDMSTSMVGVNTLVPNRLIRKAILRKEIPAFADYETVVPEVRVGRHSRLDLMLEDGSARKCYVEIKNCTLVDNRTAMFPDAVTSRGRNHLLVLQELRNLGHRCAMVFLIQRMDAHFFTPADHIDPAYGAALRTAVKNGVEIFVYDVKLDLRRIRLRGPVSWGLDRQYVEELRL
jgi:sugar fermentation stimulation protein A